MAAAARITLSWSTVSFNEPSRYSPEAPMTGPVYALNLFDVANRD